MNALSVILLLFVALVLAQGIATIWLNLWVWEVPGRVEAVASPDEYLPAKHAFTVMLPCRDEVAVIGETLRRVASASYPKELLEFLVICEIGDAPTVDAAQRAIDQYGIENGHVVIFDDKPINKPHGLNCALAVAAHEITVVFDAEDDVHPDLFSIVDTILQQENPDVVQAGVQLMDYRSHWFSSHNVLEYYFWFKSRMHVHAKTGVVPLGGNTVFFRTEQVREVGGWDENCLTEDAEIGLRLSSQGKVVRATYDPRHVTREETPDSLKAFVKQRTRWDQGFLQIALGRQWAAFPSVRQCLMGLYLLSFPFVQALMLMLTPLVLIIGLVADVPIALAVLAFVPLMLVGMQLVISVIGLSMFCREQGVWLAPQSVLLMIITYLPYQVILGVGAMRSVVRLAKGDSSWEKTGHSGQHRTRQVAAADTTEVRPSASDPAESPGPPLPVGFRGEGA
jgi:cellulose synthase/poly-beta-1,6-N-acetylglucosamine synthase-like glycosyltransferase